LILPGSDVGHRRRRGVRRRFLEAGVPVAAICGATAGLARTELLDQRNHTSAAPEYLAATGYAGADRYRNERAVVDGDLITAGPQSRDVEELEGCRAIRRRRDPQPEE
jgi:putative intracellular protease/amidase